LQKQCLSDPDLKWIFIIFNLNVMLLPAADTTWAHLHAGNWLCSPSHLCLTDLCRHKTPVL